MANNKAYLLPNEISDFYDVRRLLQLISDDNVPFAEADLSVEASEAYLKLTKLIRSVSATIDSRCQVGRRYRRDQLEVIAETARGVHGAAEESDLKRFAILQRLTADLLWGDLVARRGFAADKVRELAPRYEDALMQLEQLYQGMALFDIDENLDASVPERVEIGKDNIRGSQFNRMFGLWPSAHPDQPNNPYGLLGSWRYYY